MLGTVSTLGTLGTSPTTGVIENSPTIADKFPAGSVSILIFSRRLESDENEATESLPAPQVLLVQRGRPPNKGMWSFPGGKMRHGERAVDAAKREMLEETALSIDEVDIVDRPISATDSISEGCHYVILQFLGFAKSPNAKLKAAASSDATDLTWRSVQEIATMETTGKTVGELSAMIRVAVGLTQCEQGCLLRFRTSESVDQKENEASDR